MRGQKDFLAEPGVKRTDILRREGINRKPTKVGAKLTSAEPGHQFQVPGSVPKNS